MRVRCARRWLRPGIIRCRSDVLLSTRAPRQGMGVSGRVCSVNATPEQ